MKICGPKCSIFGILLSVWGIIQLVSMGIFFYVKSVALVDDLGEAEFKTLEEFYSSQDKLFETTAVNCWIAAALYVLTLCLSAHQFNINRRSSLKR